MIIQTPATRGQIIDMLEDDVALIRSIENWNHHESPVNRPDGVGSLVWGKGFTAVFDRQCRPWDNRDNEDLQQRLQEMGWKIHEEMWRSGTCACICIIPVLPVETTPAGVSLLNEDKRPPIGSVVQHDGDYTGLVTIHHVTRKDEFFVEWHKWGNSDDESLWGWESVGNKHIRPIERRDPRQWWPTGRGNK